MHRKCCTECIVWTMWSRKTVPQFSVMLLTCQGRILNPTLGFRDSFVQSNVEGPSSQNWNTSLSIFIKIPHSAQELFLVLCDLCPLHYWPN